MALRIPVAVERAVTRAILSLPAPVLRRIVGPVRRSPDGLTLDLQLQALLWLIALTKVPALSGGEVAVARAALDRAAPTLDLVTPGVTVYDRTVPGADGPRRARVYVPTSAPPSDAPGLVYFHGGGWVVGSIESHDRVCRALAHRASLVVVSVDYRLAPEHPFPAAPEDAIAGTRWVLANAALLGMDASRVAVGGDSAGGNLAAVVSLALRDEARRPAFQLLIYPATDLTRALPSHALFGDSYFLSKAAGDWYLGLYLRSPGDATKPLASPLFVDDLSRLPPALVITAGFDPLRDEGKAYAEKMRAADVPVEQVCLDGQMHGFLVLGSAVRDASRTVDLVAARLRSALAKAGPRARAN
ncbi:MAG TPA: alpha/beta hydrolase [Polyangiaceae bacterium]|jgi:acetyl esterase